MRSSRGPAGALTWALLAALAAAQGARQSPPDPRLPRVEVVLGLESLIPHHSRTPVLVEITAGTEPVRAEMVCSLQGAHPWSHRARVELEAGRSWHWRDLIPARGDVTVDLIPDDDAPPRHVEAGGKGSSGQPLVVLVDPRALDLNQTLFLPGTVAERSTWETLELYCARPLVLPDEVAAYGGVQAVVMGRVQPGDLEPSQLDALNRWVATGGTLILGTGQRPDRLTGMGLGDLTADLDLPAPLPVRKVRLLEEIGGTELRPVPLADLRPLASRPDGTVIAEEKGLPLVISLPYALGQRLVLAYHPMDPSVRGWKGLPRALGLGHSEHPWIQRNGTVDSLRGAGRQARSGGRGGITLLLLGVGLAAVLLPYLAARWVLRRPGATWLLAPPTALLAAVLLASATRFMAERSPSSLEVAEVTCLPSGAGPSVTLVSICALSSGRRGLDLETGAELTSLELDYPDIDAAGWERRPGTRREDRRTFGDLPLQRWQTLLAGGVLLAPPEADPAPGATLHLGESSRPEVSFLEWGSPGAEVDGPMAVWQQAVMSAPECLVITAGAGPRSLTYPTNTRNGAQHLTGSRHLPAGLLQGTLQHVAASPGLAVQGKGLLLEPLEVPPLPVSSGPGVGAHRPLAVLARPVGICLGSERFFVSLDESFRLPRAPVLLGVDELGDEPEDPGPDDIVAGVYLWSLIPARSAAVQSLGRRGQPRIRRGPRPRTALDLWSYSRRDWVAIPAAGEEAAGTPRDPVARNLVLLAGRDAADLVSPSGLALLRIRASRGDLENRWRRDRLPAEVGEGLYFEFGPPTVEPTGSDGEEER